MGFLAGLLGGGHSKTMPISAAGMQMQTSTQGLPIPLVFGTTKVAPNLIWYGDFKATPLPQSSAGKGGVGGGGGKGGASGQYTYQAAFAMGLCDGPIIGVGNVYANNQITTLAALGFTLFTGSSLQTPWGYLSTAHNNATTISATVPSSGPYTITAPNWVSDSGIVGSTSAVSFTHVSSSPASGQYSTSSKGLYTFNVANKGAKVSIYYTDIFGARRTQTSFIPTASPYTIQVNSRGNGFQNSYSVTELNAAYTLTGGAPAALQYSVSAGVYTFNSANASAAVSITYNTSGNTAALGYNYLAYIASAAYQMGSSPAIPNHNVEVNARYSNSVTQEVFGESWIVPAGLAITTVYSTQWTADVSVTDDKGNTYANVGSSPAALQYTAAAGIYTFNTAQSGAKVFVNYAASAGPDADPSLVVNFLLTDALRGSGYPSSKLAGLTNYQNYCLAMGLLISPAYITQSPCSSMITDIMIATNSAPVFSSGVLSIIPYGDTTITANGKTYTAPSAAQYDVGDDDFVASPGGDPVYLDRASNADFYNSIQLECLDRANQYNPAVIGAKDQALIDTYGLRENTINSHIFANLACGRLSAQLQLQKEARRNKYRFTLDHRYVLLDPMDIITLTASREDGTTWLNKLWVRIETIDEDENGNFAIVAEQYDAGTSHAATNSFQSGVGFAADYNSDPGNANTPVIFEPPIQVAQTGGLEVDIACSGGSNWGGCDVFISTDGNTYKNAGRVTGAARQGVIVGTFATGVDPDTTHTLNVDLTESAGSLLSGTQADADNNHTLCYVDGELISYQTANLTAESKYSLTTYLRRGQFGTTISSHADGSQFARLDGAIFAYAFDKSKIGATIYIKLVSFNIYNGGLQAMEDVSPFTHVLTGPPIPATVTGFQAQQQGNVVACNWVDLAYEGGLKGYDIAYGLVSSAWDAKLMLTEAHRGTEMTNASVPPGTWEISIRAHDIADNLGVAATVPITVTNTNPLISSVSNEPDWLGTITNFFKHYTGVLTPLGTKTVDQYTALSAPAAPTLSTTAGGTIALATYYSKITYIDAGGESLPSSESSQAVLLNNLLTCASPIASGLASGWNLYVSTSAGTETLQNSAPIPIGTNWTEPTTGLVAGAALPTNNTTGWQVFNLFVPDPVTSASYIAPTFDTGYNANLRVYSTISYGLGFGNATLPTMGLEIDTWLNGAADPVVFQPWTIGFINMEYLRAELLYSSILQGGVAYVSDFTSIIDVPNNVENAVVVIAGGGSTVTFPTQFHAAPYIEVTVVSGTALYAEATSITATTAVINVYNNSGTSVGGTVNYSATGQ